MANVELTDAAKEDLLDTYSYLLDDSFSYAELWLEEFYEKLELLKTFPKMGRMVPESGFLQNFREIFVGRYRILYFVEKENVRIIGIRHSNRPLN